MSHAADGLTALHLAMSEVDSQGTPVDVGEMPLLPPFCDLSGIGNATPFPDSPDCLLPSALTAEVSLSPPPGQCGRQGAEMA